MAKIDSVGRMRLPPDSGIRTQAHSRREHATSEPVKQAMTEWFQTIQNARRGAAEEALTNSIRSVLTDAANRGEATPRALPLQVLTTLPSEKPGQHLYQVQLGQSLLTLSSRTPLEPGQTLMVTPGKNGPMVINPTTGEQQRLVQILSQQQQLNWLPAPQPRTSLAALVPWLNASPNIPSPTTTQTPEMNTPQGNQPGVPSQMLAGQGSTAIGVSATTSASWLAVALQQVIGQWQQAMPQSGGAANSTTLTNSTNQVFQALATQSVQVSGSATSSNTVATGSSASSVVPTQSSGTTALDGNGQRIQHSDHWIPQLVRTATQQFGVATPDTVRQVWNSWQQAASAQARAVPMPDLAQAGLRPTSTGQSTLPPAPQIPPGPSIQPPSNTATSAAKATAAPTNPSAAMTPTRAATLADLAPVLRASSSAEPGNRANTDSTQTSRVPTVPVDIWRIAAEQLIDLRLQQLGQAPQHSLQEALQRRAEQLMRQTTMTYSPAQLKQQFQRGTAGGQTPTAGGQNAEQQALLQVRQLLDQVGQQQQVRTLQLPLSENPNEMPRQLQGIPVLADQQVVWFDLERQPPPEGSDNEQEATHEWVLDMHFQLPPMAPVCARLRWQKDHGRLEFLTDDTPTLRALHSHMTTLQDRLQRLHMPIDDIQVRHGLPKRQQATDEAGSQRTPDHRIDVRT